MNGRVYLYISKNLKCIRQFPLAYFGLILHIIDIAGDYYVATQYILSKRNVKMYLVYGILTIFFAIFPSFVSTLKVIFFGRSNSIYMFHKPKYCWLFYLIFQGRLVLLITNINYLKAAHSSSPKLQKEEKPTSKCASFQECPTPSSKNEDEKNQEYEKLADLVKNLALTESFIGNLPQLIIQLYVTTAVQHFTTIAQFLLIFVQMGSATIAYSFRFKCKVITKAILFFLAFLFYFTRIVTLVVCANAWEYLPILVLLLHWLAVLSALHCINLWCCEMYGGEQIHNIPLCQRFLHRWHNAWIPTGTGFTLCFAALMAIVNAFLNYICPIFTQDIDQVVDYSFFKNDKVMFVTLNYWSAGMISNLWIIVGVPHVLYLLILAVGRIFKLEFYLLIDNDEYSIFETKSY
ncbi:uncharacterized protein LOC105849339 [Hydra vulgaris]|uniref:uncharacterized protein LOC105849339 n=1 Tax=Hydra vulgaris TaxID=6087 RepID=UPI000641407A|nr:uncharacterized protein LOC105849339 [Hydra vulgaris]